MADYVAITAGTGTNIITDDCGPAGHAQVVKLAISADGDATLVPTDATYGIDVDVTRVKPDGTNVMPSMDTAARAAFIKITDSATTALSLSSSFGDAQSNTQNSLPTESHSMGFNGTSWDRLRSTITGGLLVSDASLLVDDDAFDPGISKIQPIGLFADDAAFSLTVEEGDIGSPRITLDRKQVMVLGESGANLVRGGGSKTDTSDQAIMAAVASKYNYLHWVSVYNASSTNTYVNIKDGSTVVAVIPLPAYGGAIFNPSVPIRSTVNTAINLAAGASVTTAYLYGGGYVGY